MFVKPFVLFLLLNLPIVQPISATFANTLDNRVVSQDKKESAYTKEQQEKLRQAEKAADHFVQRWRETLDLNILFDELYVTDPTQRERSYDQFCNDLLGNTGCRKVEGKPDKETIKCAFLSFWNLFFLTSEYELAFGSPDNESLATPPEAEKLSDEFEGKLDEIDFENDKSVQTLIKFTNVYEGMNAIYRKHLPLKSFSSNRYKQNYEREYAEDDKVTILTDELSGFPLKSGETIYQVKRGDFDLFFVEEAGQFKVLTIGYEL